jgi:hypothetical protein
MIRFGIIRMKDDFYILPALSVHLEHRCMPPLTVYKTVRVIMLNMFFMQFGLVFGFVWGKI